MQSSSNYFELVAEFKKNIDWLNQIIKGGKFDTITVDGVLKPSISKDIDEQYGAIKAMVQGRTAYKTKSELPSSNPSGIILAEVWNDPIREHNGLYGWDGLGWTKSPYDSTTEFVSMVDGVRMELGEANTSHERAGLNSDTPPIYSSEGDEYAGGISDEFGRLIMAFGFDGLVKIFTKLAVGFAKIKTEDDRAGISADDDEIKLGVRRGGSPFMGKVEHHLTNEVEYAIMDDAGRIAFQIFSDGSIETVGQRVGDAGDDFAWSVQDKDGRVAFMILNDGTVDFLPSQRLVEKISPSILPPYKPLVTEHLHLLMHGQSLSVGLGSKPTITGPSNIGALMPDSGFYDGDSDVSQGLLGGHPTSTAYVPLTTIDDPSSSNEVPTAGACEQLQKMFNDANKSVNVIGSNCGHGGYRIDQLDKEGNGDGPTPNYQLGVEQSVLYKSHSSKANKHCLTQAMLWMQGETDVSAGTSKSEYKRRLTNLIMDFSNDINQGHQPVLMTYQVGSHTKRYPNATPEVPIGQWELSNEHPYVFMACPTYIFDYNSDGVHLNNHSSRWIGCYFGKAMYQLLTSGSWKPLQPERVNRQGKIIWIDMHVPVPPLVIDTERVSNPGDYGFEVWTGEVKHEIASVEIVGDTVIKIMLTADPSQPVEVCYGMGVAGNGGGPTTGPRGNIRDSDLTVAAFNDASGQPYELFNWCVIFKKVES